MKPIIPPKYNIQFIVDNGNIKLLETLEPWCDNINMDIPQTDIDAYIKKEQVDTQIQILIYMKEDYFLMIKKIMKF